ncbi:MAG: hypothetical protein FWC10_09595 [Lentimicrobiaceae bacterium]|nr:hypothetical protein [Lentimicrobiaceae bacterium]
MNKLILKLIYLILCFSITKSVVGQNNANDSLYHAVETLEGKKKLDAYKQLTVNLFYTSEAAPEVIHMFIAEAQKQKDLKMEAHARKQQICYFYIWNNIEQFEKTYPDYMEFARKNKFYEDFFEMFALRGSILCRQGKYDEALRETEELHTFAKELESPYALGAIHRCFGSVYKYQYRFEQAEDHYVQALSYFRKAQNLRNENSAAMDLSDVLKMQNKYKELEQLMPDIEDIYQRMVNSVGEEIVSELFGIHRLYMHIYIYYEQFDKVQIYVKKIEAYLDRLPKSYHVNFQVALLDLYKMQKKYTAALAVADSLYQYFESTNHTLNILEIKAEQVRLLACLNRGEEAAEKFDQYYEMHHALEIENANLKLDEFRTQYEVEKLTAEKERNLNYFLFTLGTSGLLLIALGIWLYYSRTILRKNRDLYSQIKEQDSLAEELEAMSRQYERMSQLIPPASDVGTLRATSLPGTHQQRHLVSPTGHPPTAPFGFAVAGTSPQRPVFFKI